MKESQGRNLKQELGGRTAEAMEGWSYSPDPPGLLSLDPGPPAQRWHHLHELGPPSSIINEENTPQTYLQASLTKLFLNWSLLK